MNVFTLCEKSRVVADAYERYGHKGYSIDLEPSYKPNPRHFQGDMFKLIGNPVPAGIDFALMFPECRNLCSSGQHRTGKPGQRTQKDVDDAIGFFLRCVALAEQLPVAVIENSIGIMSTIYRKPNQIIQPWMFGEDASKATCLWFFGDVPRLKVTKFISPRMVCQKCKFTSEYFGVMKDICCCGGSVLPRWSNQTDTGQNRLPPSVDRSARRADFYPGVADAMVQQWGGQI